MNILFNILLQKLDLWEKKAKVLKEKLLEKLSTADGVERLELIDTLYRLGVSYNFDKEIEEALEKMCKTYDEDAQEDNLYYLALRFRLLRQHGWNASSGTLLINGIKSFYIDMKLCCMHV